MRTARCFVVGVIAAAVLILGSGRPASAYTEFRKEFIAKYVKKDSSDAKDKAFAEACDKAKCNICHEGKTKKSRNPYGQALDKLLSEDDKEDAAKIKQSLEKVAAMKAKKDAKATFGELLKAGKLPCEEKK